MHCFASNDPLHYEWAGEHTRLFLRSNSNAKKWLQTPNGRKTVISDSIYFYYGISSAKKLKEPRERRGLSDYNLTEVNRSLHDMITYVQIALCTVIFDLVQARINSLGGRVSNLFDRHGIHNLMFGVKSKAQEPRFFSLSNWV